MTLDPSLDTGLARMLCARLCHDLGGAVGSLSGSLDLLPAGEDELLALARETGAALRQRLRLYAAAWGGPTDDFAAAALAAMLAGSPAAPRVRFDLSALAPGALLPAALVPIALNAALLAAEALPRGGLVTLSGSAGEGFAVRPQGKDAAWPPALLAGAPAEAVVAGGPRQVIAPLLLALLAEAGWSASFGIGAEGGTMPLLLSPR